MGEREWEPNMAMTVAVALFEYVSNAGIYIWNSYGCKQKIGARVLNMIFC